MNIYVHNKEIQTVWKSFIKRLLSTNHLWLYSFISLKGHCIMYDAYKHNVIIVVFGHQKSHSVTCIDSTVCCMVAQVQGEKNILT